MIEFTVTIQEKIIVCGDIESVTNVLPNITIPTEDFESACKQAVRKVFEQNGHRDIQSVTLGKYKNANQFYYNGWQNTNKTFNNVGIA